MTSDRTIFWNRWKGEITVIASFLVMFLMIDGQSLWSDEACTAIYAVQKGPADFWSFMKSDTGGDPLMPLSLISIWSWGHLFGTGEWTLRALNLVWGALGLLALYLTGRKALLPGLPALAILQPYIWYYTNELRPYAGQLAIGSWLLYCFVAVAIDRRISVRTWCILLVAGTLLYCSSVLAPVVLLPFSIALLIFVIKERVAISRPPFLLLFAMILCGLALSYHYWETLTRGASGVRHWSVTPLNLGYMIYEVVGASGLGPPLPVIRELYFEKKLAAAAMGYAPQCLLIALFGIVYANAIIRGASVLWRQKRWLAPLLAFCIFLVTTMLLFAFGMATGKAFWARHLAPVFPFYLFFLGLVIAACWRGTTWRVFFRGGIILLFAIFLLASLRTRFSPEYAKEDIRRAIALTAKDLAADQTVFLASEWRAAIYYGLIPASNTGQNPHLITDGAYLDDPERLRNVDVVIFSNRQFFRNRPALEQQLGKVGVQEEDRFGTFIVYRKPEALKGENLSPSQK